MRTIVVPAVNERSARRAHAALRLAEQMGPWVQIDCADGRFVRHRTLGWAATARLSTSLRVELHLMVTDPQIWLPVARAVHAQRVAFHVEAAPDLRPLVAALRVHGITPVAAINPSTPFSRLTRLLPRVRAVLLLGVIPGPSGGKFRPVALARTRALRRRHPGLSIGIDGGLTPERAETARRAGCDRIVVGSGIFHTPNPLAAFAAFTDAVRP